ncbi:MAG: hypothetical protein HZB09_01235 [Candidatus Yonathbacteria bacterium]|nr:hypothetical protein [Candidatus Yonathbacteria bacterium]
MIKKIFLASLGLLFFVPIAQADTSVLISNEKVTVVGPQTVSVTWTTNVPANGRVVYGPVAQAILAGAGVSPQYGYASSTAEIAVKTNEHTVAIGPVMGGMTYFRPVSSDGTSTAIGKEMSIDASLLNGSCAYVKSYLKKGADNDPREVKNLQAFLRGVEKDTTVEVNGVFDDATYNAVSNFQAKYKDDVLTPWGVNTPTGYVYITTKRKINEIFCSTKIALTKEEEVVINISLSGGGSSGEIGRGTISNDGSLAWSDASKATGTGALLDDAKGGSVVGGTWNIKGKLSAFVGGTKDFLSHNQLFMLFLFVVAFVAIYLLKNKDTQPKALK